MKAPRWNKRFMASTRGRIVGLLRGASCTVNDLAEALDLTDNAVRAHLATLERDGLVQHSGERRGLRRPHLTYQLTAEAEQLFPKAYGPLLDVLLGSLKGRFPPAVVEDVLRDVGRRLAAGHASGLQEDDLEQRMAVTMKVLGELGGLAQVEKHDGHFFIRGDSCPLSSTVSSHPEVCRLTETLVAEIAGVPVQEHCNRNGAPQCCFEIMAPVKQ